MTQDITLANAQIDLPDEVIYLQAKLGMVHKAAAEADGKRYGAMWASHDDTTTA